jgi:hypothetical protein
MHPHPHTESQIVQPMVGLCIQSTCSGGGGSPGLFKLLNFWRAPFDNRGKQVEFAPSGTCYGKTNFAERGRRRRRIAGN